jgi:hypothetical protein
METVQVLIVLALIGGGIWVYVQWQMNKQQNAARERELYPPATPAQAPNTLIGTHTRRSGSPRIRVITSNAPPPPPSLLPSQPARLGRAGGGGSGQLVIHSRTTKQICGSCHGELASTDATVRCALDHRTHASCIEQMGGKCPKCQRPCH